MARISFSTARTGKRQGRGNNLVENFEFEMGQTRRIVIPRAKGDGIVILGQPIHRVGTKGVLKLMSRNGKLYNTMSVRCSHPFSQTSDKEALKVALLDEPCVFCQIANLEQRKQYEAINEQFGEDGFSKLTKEEQKKFYQEYEEQNPPTVEKSYFKVTDDDGNTRNQTQLQMYLLILDIQLEDDNKTVKTDANGVPLYKPLLMPVSQARVGKFYSAVETAIVAEQLSDDMIHEITTPEGEKENVGFIDFLVNFPKKDTKMASGKDMQVTPMPKTRSVVDDKFMTDVYEKMEVILESAETLIQRVHVNLQVVTAEKALDMVHRPNSDISGEEYFNGLKEKYGSVTHVNEKGEQVLGDVDAVKRQFQDVINRAKTDPVLSKMLIGTKYESEIEVGEVVTQPETIVAPPSDATKKSPEPNITGNETEEERKAKLREALSKMTDEQKKAYIAKIEERKKAEEEAKAIDDDIFLNGLM